jgi:hypothetical protein
VRAAALVGAKAGRMKEARAEILRFHDQLCRVRVLDPACGSGNFLYVTLEHLKRLEGEVLDAAAGFGETMLLDLSTHTVDPHQFLGLELNPRAAALAEMVLWIGYLQWHFRTRGEVLPAEPVLKKFRNIECRDAVLAWDGDPVPVTDDHGHPVTVWDRRSMKTDPVTGRDIPDESHRLPLLTYPNARPADWPETDFIVGNPPFLGNKRMRDDLGDGYAETLRAAYPDVPESADFVMYWWHKAAAPCPHRDRPPFRPHHYEQPPPDFQPQGRRSPSEGRCHVSGKLPCGQKLSQRTFRWPQRTFRWPQRFFRWPQRLIR